MNHTDHFEIQQKKPDHHFRTEIPNIIFELGMNPYCITVYLHLKKITGDGGQCWRSLKSLAEICQIGLTKLKECLDELSNNNCLDCPLITIIPRVKSDGSKDTNIILINDFWKINGDFYRAKEKDQIPRMGGSQIEGGVGRQATGGVSRQATGGRSPHGYKEQPSKEDPCKEQTKQENVVCSSFTEDQEKRKILKPYELSEKFLKSVLHLNVNHIQQSVLAFEQYKIIKENKNEKLENPLGALRNALICSWKPNVTKEEKIKSKENQKREIKKLVEYNYKIAKYLFDIWCDNFTNQFSFSLSENLVTLKYDTGFFPLPLDDECFEIIINQFINEKLYKEIK